jgi:hypothetical protein
MWRGSRVHARSNGRARLIYWDEWKLQRTPIPERDMTKPSPAQHAEQQQSVDEEALLDEALDETFPASDPIAVDAEPEDNEARKHGKS